MILKLDKVILTQIYIMEDNPMPEAGETNIEIAHKLCETNGKDTGQSSRSEFIIEILEAIILALVAVATAWSGYQAAQWDGYQAELYAEANILNVEVASLITTNGQELLYNTNTLNAWLNAKFQGNNELAQFYERRFLEEYKIAFDAWIKTDPFNNSQAPIGPIFMPEYHSSKMEEAANLSSEASAKFHQGTNARATADDYILITVFLATVLVLTAISQRFEIKSIRTGLIILSFGLISLGILTLIMLPRF
jgi:hypothetical protein